MINACRSRQVRMHGVRGPSSQRRYGTAQCLHTHLTTARTAMRAHLLRYQILADLSRIVTLVRWIAHTPSYISVLLPGCVLHSKDNL